MVVRWRRPCCSAVSRTRARSVRRQRLADSPSPGTPPATATTSSQSSSTTRLIVAARAPTTSRTASAMRATSSYLASSGSGAPSRVSPPVGSPTTEPRSASPHPPVAVLSRLVEPLRPGGQIPRTRHGRCADVIAADVRRRLAGHRRPPAQQRYAGSLGVRDDHRRAGPRPGPVLQGVTGRPRRTRPPRSRGPGRPAPGPRRATTRRSGVPAGPASTPSPAPPRRRRASEPPR